MGWFRKGKRARRSEAPPFCSRRVAFCARRDSEQWHLSFRGWSNPWICARFLTNKESPLNKKKIHKRQRCRFLRRGACGPPVQMHESSATHVTFLRVATLIVFAALCGRTCTHEVLTCMCTDVRARKATNLPRHG